jgi:precorrin-6B C5,15-methyltransferase / cobalt-precorrin-6B C5,C15-methyltransferase
VDGLNKSARMLIEAAEIVFGGTRHLSLAAPLIRGTSQSWRSPLENSVQDILAHRGRPVCVLASGDPFQHGIGGVLARHVSSDEAIVIPAMSAYSLAAARLLWPLDQTTLLSMCGRPLDCLRPHLQPHARILALTSGAAAPAMIAELLCSLGFPGSQMTVLESLGGPGERIRSSSARGFDIQDIAALNTVALEIIADTPAARVLARAPGLPDELFEHDGQITKREIRALTLSALAPRRGELLWDVGAGSGSVAIEWMLADPSLHAVALERRSDRAARIRRNAVAFGVPDLQLVEGDAPAALEGLQAPDAVFVGGGASTPGTIETIQLRLRTGGRLVVNAVTLESEAVLLRAQAQQGGDLLRVEIQRARPIVRGGRRSAQSRAAGDSGDSGYTSWQPARPITQWTWVKR